VSNNGAAEIRSTAQSQQLIAPSSRFAEKAHLIAQLQNMLINGNTKRSFVNLERTRIWAGNN
jgi:hypothetical protein